MNKAAKAKTIGERWIDSCCRPGNPELLIDTLGTRLNTRAALAGSIVLSRRIRKISPEQHVGFFLPTSAGAMLANMAAAMLGKTLVNLNYTAGRDAILSAIDQAGVRTVYTSSRFLQKLEARGIDTGYLDDAAHIVVLEELRAGTSFAEKVLTLLACKTGSAARLKKRYCIETDPESPAVILFSSGSEGDPKGVVLSHRNILTNVDQIMEVLKVDEHDIVLANLPLFHAFGLTVTQFMPMLERVTVVCHPDPTDVVPTATAIAGHKVTLMFGTSSFYRLYIRNPKVQPKALASLRLVIAGAEKLQEEVREAFRKKFGKTILEGYGVTETAPVASVNMPDILDGEKIIERHHKPGSVGRALPGTKLMIVDPDTHDALPNGEAGMILISGGQVMTGYLNAPERSAEVLPELDGRTWYVTGDKGYIDDDGFLHIQDRYSRFAKIGGEMVGLGKVEAAIRSVENDMDLEVVAVNVPHPRKGESIVVLATRELDEKKLRKKLGEAGLHSLAVPSACYKVDEIPRLGSGKTDFGSARKMALRIRELDTKYRE